MKKNLTTAGLLALVVATIVLSLANRQEVVVNYIFGVLRLPLILVIVGAVAIGMLIQYLLGLGRHLSLKHEIKGLKKQLVAKPSSPSLVTEPEQTIDL